jgi:hypothetical protein
MKVRSICIALGIVVLLLSASDTLRAQQKKPDVLTQIKVYQNGSEVQDFNFTQWNGVQGSVRLIDGTELRVTVTPIPH